MFLPPYGYGKLLTIFQYQDTSVSPAIGLYVFQVDDKPVVDTYKKLSGKQLFELANLFTHQDLFVFFEMECSVISAAFEVINRFLVYKKQALLRGECQLFFWDNFSRAILACKVATEYNSEMARQTLEEVLQRFGLMNKEGTLVTDDGMENKGKLEGWVNKPGMLWKKLIAQLDIIQSNSMVEVANKILKYRFLYTSPVANTDELTLVLENAVSSYMALHQMRFSPEQCQTNIILGLK